MIEKMLIFFCSIAILLAGSSCIQISAQEQDIASNPAHRLATLINAGEPVRVADEMSFQDLQSSLGTIEKGSFGWRRRVGSFFDYLEPNLPEQFDEDELALHTDEPFTTPLLITRKSGGVAAYLAKRVRKQAMLVKNPVVRPSRCSSLAVNYNNDFPPRDPTTGGWDRRLQPFQKCNACAMSFQHFHNLSTRPFDLATKASDPGNIQLQTHGIQGKQLKPLMILFKRKYSRPQAMFSHVSLRKTFLHPDCRNAPAMGFAGSLRGLSFHKHQANMNEVVLGRKLWIIFPPRSLVAEPHAPCPWPPWKPDGAELSFDNSHIDRVLQSFFEGDLYNATGTIEIERKLNISMSMNDRRSCFEQNMTPLQWLVYEYPQMKPEHRPFLFVASSGQVVWIPDDWPHATINIDDVFYVHKGSCADQRGTRANRKQTHQQAIERTCRKTGRFCNDYCHAGGLCTKCNGYDGVECEVGGGGGHGMGTVGGIGDGGRSTLEL